MEKLTNTDVKEIYPRPVREGDTIAIVSPASIIKPQYVAGAVEALSRLGCDVKVMPHALGSCGTYSGSVEERLEDIVAAFTDPKVRAILCSRGGYGCAHLLERLSGLDLAADPKWLIGFSDVSALHALMSSRGIVSIHGSMAKALAIDPIDAPHNAMLVDMLFGRLPVALTFGGHKYNVAGEATGRLRGGNLAVLQALMSTPYDVFDEGILFIEDIAEPIYKVERILYQLKLSGRLDRIKGLIIGQFTEYDADRNFSDIYDMIAPIVRSLGIPVAFDAPIGHVRGNMPLLHGARVTLHVGADKTEISY